MSVNTPRRAAAVVLAAILSVVMISAGTATAAKLITGKDIKNGSITGKDIKNKSIGAVDLKAGAKKSLTGPAGPVGPAGAAGAKGLDGAPGPAVLTDVYTASVPFRGFAQGSDVLLINKELPAGKAYLLTAKLDLTTAVGVQQCTLRSGADVIDHTLINTTVSPSKNQMVLMGVTASSDPAKLSCLVTGGNGVAQMAKLTAVPVASIG